MKKKQTLNALMAAVASLPCMIACTQSYPGLDYDIEDGVQNTETYDKTPIMVFVNEQNFFSISTLLTSGSIIILPSMCMLSVEKPMHRVVH